jgi:hypothetical protein
VPNDETCGTGYADVVVQIENFGNSTLSNIPVTAELTGIVNTVLSAVYAGPLAPGATAIIALGTVNTLAGGSLTVKAYTSVTGDADNSNDTTTVTLTIYEMPEADAGIDQEICQGDEIILAASPSGMSYEWSSGETTQDITVEPEITTTFTVTVTSPEGCSDMAEVTITVNELPEVTFPQAPLTLCENSSPETLAAGTPPGGIYSGTGVSGNSFDPDEAGVGIHEVTYTYTDANGCSNSETVEITVEVCTGISPDALSGSIIYPNPASGSLNIVLSGSAGNVEMITTFTIINIVSRGGSGMVDKTLKQ